MSSNPPSPGTACPPNTPPDTPPDDSPVPYALPIFICTATAAFALTSFLHNRRFRLGTADSSHPLIAQSASTDRTTSPTDDDHPPLTPSAACALARAWLAADPDTTTCDQVSAWLSSYLANAALADPTIVDAVASLPQSLDPANSRLRFGTAGVRARMGPGYDRLNALTVITVAQAVASVCSSPVQSRPVVIGYDARHNSRRFAILIAQVFHHQGHPIHLFSAPVPTPLVAFHARTSHAAVALCVTASHNPAADNGIKVFWDDAIQIRPDVANRIEAAMPLSLKPWIRYTLEDTSIATQVHDPLSEASTAYINAISAKLPQRSTTQNRRTPPMVYTACHGVGMRMLADLFSAFGLPSVIPCRDQCTPDPKFPTLPFPNPEEKGVLDRAIKTAISYQAPLVFANDPDADRFAAAELLTNNDVRIFTGNEIATLLADYLTMHIRPDNASKFAVVTSTVSSKFLASMARSRGFLFREALPGFKWINKEAVDLEESGKTVLLSYEEAIGYNVTQNVLRDKDGISAAAVFAEAAGVLYDKDMTLSERLAELEKECGAHLSRNGYLRVTDTSPSTTDIFDAARKQGLPTHFGNAVVKSHRDMTRGVDTAEESGKSRFDADPASQFLTFRCSKEMSDESHDAPLIIHVRGSGTEPKIKFYSELRCSVEESEDGSARKFLEAAVESAIEQLLKPEQYHLTR